ncbi:MAG TPA: hypothetical protein VGD60_20335 [Candidatus Acidoferrales bacterium]
MEALRSASFVTILFSALFLSVLFVGLCATAFVVVQYVLTPIIRIFNPDFCIRKIEETVFEREHNAQVVRKVALDFAIEIRLLREKANKDAIKEIQQKMYERYQAAPPIKADKAGEPSTVEAIRNKLGVFNKKLQVFEKEALYRVSRGDSKHPQYLCRVDSSRRPARLFFSAVESLALEFTHASALRWVKLLDSPEFFIVSTSGHVIETPSAVDLLVAEFTPATTTEVFQDIEISMEEIAGGRDGIAFA